MTCNNHQDESNHNFPQKYDCHWGRVSRFIEPCLLLLLSQKPSHGYELMENLSGFGFYEGDPDPGAVYRNLRQMEGEELVESSWDTTGSGPAKRLYRLTPKGEDYLHSWVVSIRKRKEAFEKFLSLYKNLFDKD